MKKPVQVKGNQRLDKADRAPAKKKSVPQPSTDPNEQMKVRLATLERNFPRMRAGELRVYNEGVKEKSAKKNAKARSEVLTSGVRALASPGAAMFYAAKKLVPKKKK